MTNALAIAYDNWFREMHEDYQPSTAIKIGFEGEEMVYLPAHEAGFTGEIHFMEGHGWAHDWLVNWTNTDDSIFWEVEVEQEAVFSVSLLYSCPQENIGSTLSLQTSQSEVMATIDKPFDPDYIPSPDRVTRIEVYEKDWARLDLGEIKVLPGREVITIKAVDIPAGQVGEIKGLQLKRNFIQ